MSEHSEARAKLECVCVWREFMKKVEAMSKLMYIPLMCYRINSWSTMQTNV